MSTHATAATGVRLVMPFLTDLLAPSSLIDTNSFPEPLAGELQRSRGDFLARLKYEPREIGIEVKTEERYTGNLFVETWSNFVDGSGRHPLERQGWVATLSTDFLVAVFLSNRVFYIIPFARLKSWLFDTGNLFSGRYREKEPWRNAEQNNRTKGYPVPFKHFYWEVGATSWKMSEPAARGGWESFRTADVESSRPAMCTGRTESAGVISHESAPEK